ncbi:MAG: BatD family protein [Cryomorphaceae bacterium]|nr:BatD family protein [Cryomorphaceae bacterium]
MIRQFIFLLGFILLSTNGFAQGSGVKFVGKTSHESIGTDDRFTITYTLNARGQSFRPPENMEDHFMVLVGPNQSFQSTMTSRGFETTMQVSYTLRAKAEGNFELGPARVMVGGTPHSSNGLSIKVVKGSTQEKDPNDPEVLAAQLSWMKAILNRTEVYVGEPINVNYKLYSKTGVSGPRFESEPNFKGFITENIDLGQIEQNREFIDNEQVLTAVIKSFLLFPQQPGNYDAQKIPVTIPTNVQVQRRDSWFGSMTQRVDNKTHVTIPAIKVKPLPVSGRPDDFSGGVGKFALDISVDKTTLDADQSLTVKITLSGEGNMRLVDVPSLELPSVFETYDPRTSSRLRVADGTLKGSKSAEYLLIPRYSGTYEIPALTFSYFNPKTKQYNEVQTQPITIEVTGDKKRSDVAGGMSVGGKERVDMMSRDIMFIKTFTPNFQRESCPVIESAWYWVLWILGVLLFPLAWILRNIIFKKRLARNTRLRKAERLADRLLTEAAKLENASLRGDKLHKAIEVYFAAYLKISTSDLSNEQLRARSNQVFGEAFTREWMQVYEALEALQYGGTSVDVSVDRVKTMINKAKEWVSNN